MQMSHHHYGYLIKLLMFEAGWMCKLLHCHLVFFYHKIRITELSRLNHLDKEMTRKWSHSWVFLWCGAGRPYSHTAHKPHFQPTHTTGNHVKGCVACWTSTERTRRSAARAALIWIRADSQRLGQRWNGAFKTPGSHHRVTKGLHTFNVEHECLWHGGGPREVQRTHTGAELPPKQRGFYSNDEDCCWSSKLWDIMTHLHTHTQISK